METKSALKSVGIMGPLIILIVLGVNYWIPGLGIDEGQIAPLIEGAAAVVGTLTGIWGRWRATKQVTLTGR